MKLIQAVLLLNVAALILCGTYPLGLRSTFSDGNVMYSILGGHIYKFNLKTLAPLGQVALSENREYAPQKALFHPTDSNIVYLYSATSIDKINLSTGLITDSARAIDGFSFNGCDIDTTGIYVGYASTTAMILTRYSLSTGVAASTLSFPLSATEQAMFVGISSGIGYVALTSTSDSTLVIQRINLATFTALGPLSTNYLYESWQISNAYAVADGIALFDGYNVIASKYKIDNTKNTISLVGTLNTNTVIQVPLQDNKNKFIFSTGAECQADRNGGSCAQVMNRIIDFTNAPVFVGTAVALPASSTSWVKTTPSGWNTNGAYTFGISNGVVFYPVLTNNELTSVHNYIIATGATNEKSVTILPPCWTCAPGYSHWYDLGWNQPSNGDRCQCVFVDCWTCAPGWTHWYDLKWQQPSNGDRCQCVRTA